jgi:hypothetical protein
VLALQFESAVEQRAELVNVAERRRVDGPDPVTEPARLLPVHRDRLARFLPTLDRPAERALGDTVSPAAHVSEHSEPPRRRDGLRRCGHRLCLPPRHVAHPVEQLRPDGAAFREQI